MDDRAVIEQVLAGDNDAFGILVERYQTKIYNLALRMSFLRAWRNLGSFQFESAFSTWLFRLCSNICLDFLRAKKRRAAVSLTMTDDEGEENQLEVPDPGKTPEEAVFAAEDRELLTRALNELPADQREILTLRAIDDLSYSEIARILNLQEGTVKSRLSRARTALRKKLLQIGNKTKTESSVP